MLYAKNVIKRYINRAVKKGVIRVNGEPYTLRSVSTVRFYVGNEGISIILNKLHNKEGFMMKCELIHDHFQNFRSYGLTKAQFIIADIPYNILGNFYASRSS